MDKIILKVYKFLLLISKYYTTTLKLKKNAFFISSFLGIHSPPCKCIPETRMEVFIISIH